MARIWKLIRRAIKRHLVRALHLAQPNKNTGTCVAVHLFTHAHWHTEDSNHSEEYASSGARRRRFLSSGLNDGSIFVDFRILHVQCNQVGIQQGFLCGEEQVFVQRQLMPTSCLLLDAKRMKAMRHHIMQVVISCSWREKTSEDIGCDSVQKRQLGFCVSFDKEHGLIKGILSLFLTGTACYSLSN